MPARPGRRRRTRSGYYEPGANNVECDRTGFKYKSTECSFEWNGFFVNDESWEERQPQDFLRGIPDHQQPNVARPGTGDHFVIEVEGASGPVQAGDSPPAVIKRVEVSPEDL